MNRRTIANPAVGEDRIVDALGKFDGSTGYRVGSKFIGKDSQIAGAVEPTIPNILGRKKWGHIDRRPVFATISLGS